MILLQDGVTHPHEAFVCLGKERKSHFSESKWKIKGTYESQLDYYVNSSQHRATKLVQIVLSTIVSANYFKVFQVRTTLVLIFTVISLINSVYMCMVIHMQQFSPFIHGLWGLHSSLQAWYKAPLPHWVISPAQMWHF